MLKSLIVAMDDDDLIGNGDKLPWHEPEDLRWFKTITIGKTVVMGRSTWESLPVKPLPDRENIVISTTLTEAPGAKVFKSLEQVYRLDRDEIVFMGGASIYKQVLPVVDRVYLTEIPGSHEGDVYFPSYLLKESQWEGSQLGNENAPHLTFLILSRAEEHVSN